MSRQPHAAASVLGHILAEGGGAPVALSRREIARGAGISARYAERVLRELRRDGLLVATRRWGPDGGEIENRYELTPTGRAAAEGGRKRQGPTGLRPEGRGDGRGLV